MCAAMAPSGGRSPYGPAPNGPALNEAAAYAYDLQGGGAVPGGHAPSKALYEGRGMAYDVRSKHAPPMATPSGYYPNEEEAHFGPPGTGGYGDYGDSGYYAPQRQMGHAPRGGHAPHDGWYRGQGGAMGGVGFIEDEYVTSFSDEEADELDSRMPRGGAFEGHARAKSLLRFNELERERSRRRQTIVKHKTGSKLFPGKLKLSMMNTGLIPLKKGRAI